MTSVYRQAMGSSFTDLQPELQDYFGLTPDAHLAGHGTGVFDAAGCPNPLLRPVLAAGVLDHSFFPDYGTQVPFEIFNFAHRDPFGRNSLTAIRHLHFPRRTRIFEDTTSAVRGNGLVDYVGSSRAVATSLHCSATDGRMRLASDATRLLPGRLKIPVPAAVDARAFTEQWWDGERFRIRTKVLHPLLGELLVYTGWFTYRLQEYDGGLPERFRPRRWRARS